VVGSTLLLGATPVEAGRNKKKQARTQKLQVVRNKAHDQRRVKLERQVTRRKGATNRNQLHKTVTRKRPTAAGHEKRVVRLDKTTTNLGGKRTKVEYGRSVSRKPAAHHRNNVRTSSQHYRGQSSGHRSRSHYNRGHHSSRRSRSNYSFSFRYGNHHGNSHYGGSIRYGSGYGYGHHSRCHRCGGGYYSRVWVEPVYTTYYDDYGNPYSRIIRAGYYRNVWVSHTCGIDYYK